MWRTIYCITIIICIFQNLVCFGQVAKPDTSSAWRLKIDSSVIKGQVVPPLRGNLYVVTPLETARIISVTGENDVLKMMASKPGVSTGVEGTNGYFVRGSGTSGTRIEMNGSQLIRSSHLLGLLSSIPSEMVKNISFSPGGQNGSSGNYSSALVRIELKDGLANKKSESFYISPYIAGYFIEKPNNRRLTTRFSVRGSLAPILANSALQIFKIGKNKAKTMGGSYDLIHSLDWQPEDNISFKSVLYRTQDIFQYSFGLNKTWLNTNETIGNLNGKWQIRHNLSLIADLKFSVSEELHKEEFKRNISKSIVKTGLLSLKDRSFEYGGKAYIQHDIQNELHLDYGIDYSKSSVSFVSHKKNYSSTPALPKGTGTDTDYSLISLFIDSKFDKEKKVLAKGGLRWNHYSNDKGGNFKTLDIHALSDIFITGKFGLEATYDRNTQFCHILEGMPSGWGQDIMIASTPSYPYEKTSQVYAGIFGETTVGPSGEVRFAAGAFSKKMNGLIFSANSSHIFGVADNLDDKDIVSGSGKASGVEFMAELRLPQLSAELSYTYSSAKRTFPGINMDREFRFRFERPHMLNLTGDYLICRRKTKSGYTMVQKVNMAASLTSGHLMTLSKGRYTSLVPGATSVGIYLINFTSAMSADIDYVGYDETENIKSLEDLTELNNFRLLLYFRVDAGYSISWDKGNRGYDLSISIVNLLNRQNPYQYFYEDGKWKMLSILPLMPSVKFAWRF